MFAISTAAVLGVIGLLYSFGFVLAERRALQAAADAASLSGAWQVLTELQNDNRQDSNVRAAITRYAASNGVTLSGDVAAVYVDSNGAALAGAVGDGGAFPVTARGVRVTVSGRAASLMPVLVGAWQVLVQTSATAAGRPTASTATETLVIPIAVAVADYVPHQTYDLFAGARPLGLPPTLDLRSVGASDYGALSTDVQYWSDGQHDGGTLRSGADVRLAGSAEFDSLAAGLADNVRRQGLQDASGAAYALVAVPLWTSATAPDSVRIAGFARLKLRASDISSTSARGLFVPYAAGAFGVPNPPAPDVGALVVGIVS